MPELEISPKTVAVTTGQTQEFTAIEDGKQVPVHWSIQPSGGAGRIEADLGVYTAPRWILRGRKAVIVARPAGGGPAATAVVELVPLSFWIQFLGFYMLSAFFVLLAVLILDWKDFCPTCKPDAVRVSPPVVTLMPSASQSFAANVPVEWSGNVTKLQELALFTAPNTIPAGGSKQQIAATMTEEPKRTGTAEVFLSPDGSFFLQPAKATIRAGGSVDLTAVPSPAPAPPGTTTSPAPPQGAGPPPSGSQPATGTGTQALSVEWLKPELGTLTSISPVSANVAASPTARFSVEANAVEHPVTLLVLARLQGAATPRIAGAWITVVPASLPPGTCGDGSDVAALIRLIAFLGALGGIIHGISSFTTYVGNREFLASWVWWYVFKPFLGAVVALIVFLVIRAGFGGGDFALGAADCLRVAAFAGLIGLFAEPATLKLKDIFETLFTPRDDPRRDAAGKVRKGPMLTGINPKTLTVGQTDLPELIIDGSGFAPDCQVKIGTASLRKPQSTPTQLKVALQPDDVAKAGKLDVIVYNKPPDGEGSNTLQIEVKEKA